MEEGIAIERYERLLLKNGPITLSGDAAEKAEAAKVIIRYAVTEILGWTPQDAADHITWKIICQLKLDRTLKYLTIPPDIEIVKDPEYIACLAFPGKAKFDIRRQVLRVYNRILSGETPEFPKKIFEGGNGREKAAILLNEVILTNLSFVSTDELYELFANTAAVNRKLHEWKIFSVARKLYYTPLDYLHYSLPDEDRDEFLYTWYQYRNIYKKVIREVRAEKSKKSSG